MHVDPRSRLRRIAGIDDSRLHVIPLGRPDSFVRAYEVLEHGGIVAALADRVEAAAQLHSPLPRPAGAVSDRPRTCWRRAPAHRC